MKVEVPVSSLVRDGDFGWTCGQCPLDRSANVFAPGDLVAQTKFVCDMIDTVLQRGGFNSRNIGKLHVYYVAANASEGRAALDMLATHFPHGPLVVPIPVPYFYYDGMMIEVDVFAGPQVSPRKIQENGHTKLQIVDGGDLTWALVRCELSGGQTMANCMAEMSCALAQQGLAPANLLSDHWFIAGSDDVPKSNLVSNPNAVIRLALQPRNAISGVLTFCRDAVQATVETDENGNLALVSRRNQSAMWVSAICNDPQLDLVEQTRQIMSGIERILASKKLSFGQVAKITTHYVGDASAEDLHGNMKVRHSYYVEPGPASTGLPVSGLLGGDCRISIDVMAIF